MGLGVGVGVTEGGGVGVWVGVETGVPLGLLLDFVVSMMLAVGVGDGRMLGLRLRSNVSLLNPVEYTAGLGLTTVTFVTPLLATTPITVTALMIERVTSVFITFMP